MSIVDPSCEHAFEVGLVVSDLGASLRFYRDALGFEVRGRASNDRCDTIALVLGTGLLKLLRWHAAPTPGAPGMTTTGYRYLTIHVADADAALAACVAAGADVLIPVSRHSETVRYAFVTDPDGNAVELSEGVPWEPLDEQELAAVVAASY